MCVIEGSLAGIRPMSASRIAVLHILLLMVLGLASGVSAQEAPPYPHPLFTGPVQEPTFAPVEQERIEIYLRLDFQLRRIEGTVAYALMALESNLDSLRLMAKGLSIRGVETTRFDTLVTRPAFRIAADTLVVALDSLASGERFSLHIDYGGKPTRGLYLQGGYAWTDNRPSLTSYWLPTIRTAQDKAQIDLHVSAPAGYAVLGGSVAADTTIGRTRYTRFTSPMPQPLYRVGFIAGRLEVIEADALLGGERSVPLRYGALRNDAELVAPSFHIVPEFVQYLSDRLGYDYPWPALSLVVLPVAPTSNATGVHLLPSSVLVNQRAATDFPPEFELARRIAQQWFGSLVTSDHGADMWLHDGLATYVALRFLADAGLDAAHRSALAELSMSYLQEASQYQRPLVWDQWEDATNLDDAHAAAKGPLVWHLLVEQIGAEAFWQGARRVLAMQDYGFIETAMVQRAFEQATDQDLSAFFDHWIYSAGHPLLELTYTFDPSKDVVRISITQTQEGFLVPQVFPLPVRANVYTLAGSEVHEITLTDRVTTVELPAPMRPRFVALEDVPPFIPIIVDQPVSAWVGQLRYAESVDARERAAEALISFADDPALLVGLRSALAAEPTPRVRAATIAVMGAMPWSSALERELLAALEDDQVVVRAAAATSLGAHPTEATTKALLRRANTEQSVVVLDAIVKALVAQNVPEANDIVRAALITASHEDRLLRTGLACMPRSGIPQREQWATAQKYLASAQPPLVRTAAVTLAGHLADTYRAAQRAVFNALGDSDPRVREAALRALSGQSYPGLEARLRSYRDAETVPALQVLHDQLFSFVRDAAQ